MNSTRLHFQLVILCVAVSIAFGGCQPKENNPDTNSGVQDATLDTIDSTVFATTDSLSSEPIRPDEFIPSAQFGYYRAFTPPSLLLDEKGEKTIVNGNPVQVPATISYIQIKSGKVYGVQMAQGQQFLFTGFYDYAKGSSIESGTLNLALDGRYLKTGKPVGPWNPQINYSKKGDDFKFILIGVSGAPDSKMSFIAPEISTTRMQELMKEEESKL